MRPFPLLITRDEFKTAAGEGFTGDANYEAVCWYSCRELYGVVYQHRTRPSVCRYEIVLLHVSICRSLVYVNSAALRRDLERDLATSILGHLRREPRKTRGSPGRAAKKDTA